MDPGDHLEVPTVAGERLDRAVARALPAWSRRQVRALFQQGRVRVDGRVGKPGHRADGAPLALLDAVRDDAARPDPALPLVVVAESDAWVIVDKPAGIPSAPLAPGELKTVANALLARHPEMREVGFAAREPGLVHRLDTGTSGLLLAARQPAAFAALVEALRAGAIDKRYWLVCPDADLPDSGVIDLPLRSAGRRVRAGAAEACWPAVTHYEVKRRARGRVLIEARVGRAFRHQLRAHFAHLGAPLLGDTLYGGDTSDLRDRHALHASALRFAGTASLPGFDVCSDLPEDLAALLREP